MTTGGDLAQWRDVIDVNLTGVFHTVEVAVPQMLAHGAGGSIIMINSTAGLNGIGGPGPGSLGYTAAKHGGVGLMRAYANLLAQHGIRVNCVAPDITAVPRLVDGMGVPEEQAFATFDAMAAAEGVPLQRFGRPEELSGPLLFLLSEMSGFMTGQTLVVDGGTMVHFPHRTGGDPPR